MIENTLDAKLGNKLISSTIVKWLKPVLQVLSSQVLLQATAFGISIILIRQMPKSDYAIYTVLMSVQAMLLILSDSGLSIGFKAIGGNIWDDDKKLNALIKTAMYIRWRVIFLAFVVAGSYCTFILIKQGIDLLRIFVFLVCLLLIISAEIQKAFIQQALLLRQELAIVQLVEIINQGLRLILVVIVFMLLNKYLNAQIVLGISVFCTWISLVYIKQKSQSITVGTVIVNSEYKKVLLRYIKLNWYNTAFFAFQGQISIFLVGLFGSAKSLADLGALTKFALIFIAISSIVSNILSPAFGRCQEKAKLLKIYLMTMAALSIIIIFTLTVVYLFPQLFLRVLGDKYHQLSYELFLVFISGLINLTASTVFSLNTSKGWIKFSPIGEIPANITVLLIGVLTFNVESLIGVLQLSILGGLTILLLYIANSWAGFKQIA